MGALKYISDKLFSNDKEVALVEEVNANKGLATAWVNFDGTDGSIRSSFNVSGVVRVSTGLYTITFTTPMDNANYAVASTTERPAADGSNKVEMVLSDTKSTSTFQIKVRSSSTDSMSDSVSSGLIIFGGKA